MAARHALKKSVCTTRCLNAVPPDVCIKNVRRVFIAATSDLKTVAHAAPSRLSDPHAQRMRLAGAHAQPCVACTGQLVVNVPGAVSAVRCRANLCELRWQNFELSVIKARESEYINRSGP